MRFSDYIQSGIYESSSPKYQEELLAFLEVLKSQKETKELKKIKDAVAYTCVKGSESDQKKLYNEILSKLNKHAEKERIQEGVSDFAKTGGKILGTAAAIGAGMVAGGALGGMALAALGVPLAGATVISSIASGAALSAGGVKALADDNTDKSEILNGIKKLNTKYKITDKVKNIKKKVETKIKDLKTKKSDSNDKSSDKSSDNSGSKSKGYTGPNEQIQAFTSNIHSMGWDFESIKKYEDYDVVWYSAIKGDGTHNVVKGHDKKIKEIFNEVKKNSTSYAWLTRYWIGGGFKEPRYYISVAFGKKPDEKTTKALKKV